MLARSAIGAVLLRSAIGLRSFGRSGCAPRLHVREPARGIESRLHPLRKGAAAVGADHRLGRRAGEKDAGEAERAQQLVELLCRPLLARQATRCWRRRRSGASPRAARASPRAPAPASGRAPPSRSPRPRPPRRSRGPRARGRPPPRPRVAPPTVRGCPRGARAAPASRRRGRPGAATAARAARGRAPRGRAERSRALPSARARRRGRRSRRSAWPTPAAGGRP